MFGLAYTKQILIYFAQFDINTSIASIFALVSKWQFMGVDNVVTDYDTVVQLLQ